FPGTAEAGDLGRREGEVDELDRGRLALGGAAVLVGLGPALDALAADLDEGGLLDAAELGKEAGPAIGVVDLEQHGRDQLAAVRHQGIVGRELACELLGAAAL